MAELVSAPESTVSTDDVKVFLKVSHNVEDTLIASLIKAGISEAERYTRRRIFEQTWKEYFLTFDNIELNYGPLISLDSVKYLNESGVLTTLSTDVYEVDSKYSLAKVTRKAGESWPTVGDFVNPIEVTYTVGHDSNRINEREAMIAAVMDFVGFRYGNRQSQEMPEGFYNILSPMRLQITV